MRLTYGLNYKGNVCGDKHAGLHEVELLYWLNPNQVYQSGLKDCKLKLVDARSICLLDCPVPSEDSLNWVCDYSKGDIRLSMDDWIDSNYNYYEYLTPEMRNSSLQLQRYMTDIGKSWPVLIVCGGIITSVSIHDLAADNSFSTIMMSFITIVAILTSIAIVQRIFMGTSILKASINSFNISKLQYGDYSNVQVISNCEMNNDDVTLFMPC
ncbi:hypothetical protein AHAS_Ahas14G0181900 [Arachis hypogaea]